MVTITAQSGAVASIELSLTPADHLTFDGLTIKGAYLSGAHDVSIVNSKFTDMTRVDTTINNANILFDRDTFDSHQHVLGLL